jgi:hypothetical protein
MSVFMKYFFFFASQPEDALRIDKSMHSLLRPRFVDHNDYIMINEEIVVYQTWPSNDVFDVSPSESYFAECSC